MCRQVLNLEDIEESMEESIKKIINSFTVYCRNGSQWVLETVQHITVNVSKYQPVRGSSWISTPPKIASKKCVVNPKNTTDQKCFLWSVLASLHPQKIHAERISSYKQYESEIKIDTDFPIKISDIGNFEKQNNLSIYVYIYDYQKERVEPLYVSKQGEKLKPINLLLLQENNKSHYVWIKNLNRLLSFDDNARLFCPYCLHGFVKRRNGSVNLEKHKPLCRNYGAQRIILPEEGDNIIKFRDFEKQQKAPFVIYADFESLNCSVQTCSNSPSTSSTEKITKHIVSGFSYKIISDYKKFSQVTYRGPDAALIFLQKMMVEEKKIGKMLESKIPIKMNMMDTMVHNSSTHCYLCNKPFETEEDNLVKVRDHCHQTGNYRGAAHQICNLNLRTVKKIPVIFHNLTGYDAHIICQAIGIENMKTPEVVARNLEEYVFFKIGKLHFIDSLQHLNASLNALTENLLSKGKQCFVNTREYFQKHFPNTCSEGEDLLLKKLPYPYKYMDSVEKFNETSLPSKSDFYNDLSEEDITEIDYQTAVKVWKIFELTNLGELHDLYVESDTNLLADVFENYRTLCLQYYGLDPCHFYTCPGLSWAAALKHSCVELELFTDPDMNIFIDKGIRGGISQISNRLDN